MKTVTQRLLAEYNITAQPGKKIKCPFCGHNTLQIKLDDLFAKCFHPDCGKRIFTSEPTHRTILSSVLSAIFTDCHKEILKQKRIPGETAYNYLTKKRKIHPNVIKAMMIGAVPAGYDISAKTKTALEDVQKATENSKTHKGKKGKQKPGVPDSTDSEWLRAKLEQLSKILEWSSEWICFFYENIQFRSRANNIQKSRA